LLSRISGDDKSKYAIFSSNELALNYQNGKWIRTLSPRNPWSKDAKRLSIDKSPCLNNATVNLWFGFESSDHETENYSGGCSLVDTKLSRGWTVENRKFIIDQCKTSAVARKLANSDDFVFVSKRKFKKI
jgi:hypothetical protein